jgi:hypothetical protein
VEMCHRAGIESPRQSGGLIYHWRQFPVTVLPWEAPELGFFGSPPTYVSKVTFWSRRTASSVIPAMRDAIGRRVSVIASPPPPTPKPPHYPKNKQKTGWGRGSSSSVEALNSSPSLKKIILAVLLI